MYEEQPARLPAPTTWCDWHEGETTTALLVTVIEPVSGGIVTRRYACASCRHKYGLKLA